MTTDLHIHLILPDQQKFRANYLLNFPNPLLVQGLQKMANHWMRIFLTPKGSHPIRRKEGTRFSYLIGGNVDDLDTIQTSILDFINDANVQMKAAQARYATLPDVERFANAELQQLTQLDATSFDLWVRITNVARQSLPFLIPYASIR